MIMPLFIPKKHVFFKKSADRRTCYATIGRAEIGGVFRCVLLCLGRWKTLEGAPLTLLLRKKKVKIRKKDEFLRKYSKSGKKDSDWNSEMDSGLAIVCFFDIVPANVRWQQPRHRSPWGRAAAEASRTPRLNRTIDLRSLYSVV